MKSSARTRLQDRVTTFSGLAIIVAVVAAADETVRRFLGSVAHGSLPVGMTMPDVRVQPLLRSITDVVGRDHMQMAAFVVAGCVLFVMMFRS
jgi:hypothetical protein